MKRLLTPLFALPALIASACSTAPKPPPVERLIEDDYSLATEYLREYIPTRMKKHGFTGLSVALVDGQRTVWSDGFGFADTAAGRQVTASTGFRAGSVSKLFTALAAMTLHEAGTLDLDAPLTTHVPDFALQTRTGSVDDITMRHVLSHHSGIPSAIFDGMWSDDPSSFKTVTTRLNRYYAAYPPETVFAYSNAGYSVAGHAIENASGRPFVEYLEDELLRPLGMSRSNFRFDTGGDDMAKSYRKGNRVDELGLRDLPAGGLVTTADDLAALIKLVNANGTFGSLMLAPRTLQEMMTVQPYASAYQLKGYNALGWFMFDGFLGGKYTTLGHTGQTLAHSASLFLVPELELGVVLMTTSPSLAGGLEEITDEVLRVAHAVKSGEPLASVPAVDRKSPALPGNATGFEGLYASPLGVLNITEQSSGYDVAVGGSRLTLSGNADEGHAVRARLLGFIPVKPPGLGDVSFFARDVSGETLIYARGPEGQVELAASEIEPQAPVPAWDAALGDYVLTNPTPSDSPLLQVDKVTLSREDGVYRLDVMMPIAPQRLALMVIDDGEATLQGYGRGLGETVFLEPDGTLVHGEWRFVRKP